MEKYEEIDSRYLQTCDIPVEEFKVEGFTMVIFGGAGDLSKRMLLPSVFHLFADGVIPGEFGIIAFDKVKMTEERYRNMMKEAVRNFSSESFDEKTWSSFSKRLFYLAGDFKKDENFKELIRKVKKVSSPKRKEKIEIIFYMSVPPQITPLIVDKLEHHNLSRGVFQTKLIVEKPFGWDRASAIELNSTLAKSFNENQIFRIDHYLSKEPVRNIVFFRFSNNTFEHLWNRRYMDNVQITVAEDIGIESRGAFYEKAGVVRDVVQNHLLQLIGMVAMEPPIGFTAEFIRDEKLKIFRCIRPMDDKFIDKYVVRGQYGPGKIRGKDVPGYRSEEDVSKDSITPTFFAAKFFVDNWRWAGVPFYVRAGKRLNKRITEISLQLKSVPLRLFGRTCDVPQEANILTLSIQPDERISLRFGVKYPYGRDKIYPVNMVFNYHTTFKLKQHPVYEQLLLDCMKGDLTPFVRQDAVESAWETVDPIIARWENMPPKNFPNYAAGTWGPREADVLIKREGRRWITA